MSIRPTIKIGCYIIIGAMFLLRCALVSKSVIIEVIFLLVSIGLLALCIV